MRPPPLFTKSVSASIPIKGGRFGLGMTGTVMGIIQTGRVDIAYETSGSGEAGVVILIRGQGTQLIHSINF
jgi:hypothetical protein